MLPFIAKIILVNTSKIPFTQLMIGNKTEEKLNVCFVAQVIQTSY
jgi:hypothetical protein